VWIRTGGDLTVRDCEISDNKEGGVAVHDLGRGTFTGNTLSGNAQSQWEIGLIAGRLVRKENTPNGRWWDRLV